MLPPNLGTSGTKIKRVIDRWIALLVMEDGGCSLTFAKGDNPNIIKVPITNHIRDFALDLKKYKAMQKN